MAPRASWEPACEGALPQTRKRPGAVGSTWGTGSTSVPTKLSSEADVSDGWEVKHTCPAPRKKRSYKVRFMLWESIQMGRG